MIKDAAAIAKGMSITFGEMFKPTEVENYPDGKGPMRGAQFQQRFRGKHQLQRDENGLEKCVACFLCAAACPSNCIYIEAAENTEEVRISSAERYAKVYNIDYNRCIFCGYCVEACPTDAITHGHGFELASLNATTLGHAQGRPPRRHPARHAPHTRQQQRRRQLSPLDTLYRPHLSQRARAILLTLIAAALVAFARHLWTRHTEAAYGFFGLLTINELLD